jgi:hypothetical protein
MIRSNPLELKDITSLPIDKDVGAVIRQRKVSPLLMGQDEISSEH